MPVVSAAGPVGAQMIFGGKIGGVHPSVGLGDFLVYEHNPTHWSNEQTTLSLWNKVIIPYVARKRSEIGDSEAPVLVLADAFGAHWTNAVKELVAQQAAIFYISVPDSLTHLFQPLDLGIIAAIKNSVLRRKDDFLEKEVQKAVH